MKLLFKDIIVIDKEYLAYLQSFDDRVRQNHPNAMDRPNVAILLDDNGQKWAIPLSNSRAKHGQNKLTSLSIYDNATKDYLGHMKFNNMIPLAEDTYKTAFGQHSFQYDTLLSKQKSFIVDKFEKDVAPRFYAAFKTQSLAKSNPDNKFYAIYNDFPLLVKKARSWQTVVNIEKGIKGFLALEPPKEVEVYDILKKVFKNKPSQVVLEFKSDTKEYFVKLYNHYKYEV